MDVPTLAFVEGIGGMDVPTLAFLIQNRVILSVPGASFPYSIEIFR